MITLADVIKQARVGRYTQKEMAICLDMSQPNYANIENGFTTPDAKTLLMIARLLGVDLNKLAAGVDIMSCYHKIDEHRKQKALNAQRKLENAG